MTDELIRKSDVLEIVSGCHTSGLTFGTTARIEDLPAVTVAVKPLVWPDFREGGTCGRPAHVQYFITQDHDGDFWTHFDGEVFSTLEAAQANCEAHWQRNMQVSPTPAQPDPAAIREAAWQNQRRVDAMRRRHMNAPEDPHVAALCERYGYGAVMDAASRLWARKDSLGAFYIGGCIGLRSDDEAAAIIAKGAAE